QLLREHRRHGRFGNEFGHGLGVLALVIPVLGQCRRLLRLLFPLRLRKLLQLHFQQLVFRVFPAQLGLLSFDTLQQLADTARRTFRVVLALGTRGVGVIRMDYLDRIVLIAFGFGFFGGLGFLGLVSFLRFFGLLVHFGFFYLGFQSFLFEFVLICRLVTHF